MILYITSHSTGELIGSREAVRDIKKPERFVIPPYSTPTQPPIGSLDNNEYWAYLSDDEKPVRDYKLGSWVKKQKQVKVTAYHKQTHQAKEFEDKSLIDDEHTAIKPSSKFDEFIDGEWILNEGLKFATEEHEWVISELAWYDSKVVYAARGDKSRSDGYTKEELDDYAIALCDYTSKDVDGNITVKGDVRPVI